MITGIIVLLLRILIAVALYAFLGWALWTLWRDLRFQLQSTIYERTPLLSIEVATQEDHPVYEFREREILIGRHPSCQLILNDETVSARHARLRFRDNQWWVEDLQSTNGTFLNDERVTTQTVMISGDRLRCGQAVLHIQIQPQE